MTEVEENVLTERQGDVVIVTLNRPNVRNAVNPTTARILAERFVAFDKDESAKVAVFTGSHGTFCAGADLKALLTGEFTGLPEINGPIDRHDQRGPMGPSYLRLSKPVVGAISGHAVAGGLELALWCDLRVVEEDAVMGVFCRRWGVPLVDGGTVRLPRLIGHARAMDLILTGRGVDAQEALQMGLASRVVPKGKAREEAIALAHRIANFPQTCMRNDRRSAYEQWELSFDEAMAFESRMGIESLGSGELIEGVQRFVGGAGRSGSFED